MKLRAQGNAGFGLLELMITLVIAALIVSVAIPTYGQLTDRDRTARAIADLGRIAAEIEKFKLRNNALPGRLAELDAPVPLDPWGQPYRYLNIVKAVPKTGQFRRDKNLSALNTDYDLYSAGSDGVSERSLNAGVSRDDILRANDGAFIGRAEDY